MAKVRHTWPKLGTLLVFPFGMYVSIVDNSVIRGLNWSLIGWGGGTKQDRENLGRLAYERQIATLIHS